MLSYVNNAGWIFLERIIRVIVGFILFAIISRVLGTKDFGILSYSQTLVTMFLCIAGLGFDNILINRFAKSKSISEDEILLATAIISRIIISSLLIIILLIAFSLFAYPLKNSLIILISSVGLIFQSQNTYFSYYQAKSKYLFITKCSIVALVISSAFKIYLLLIKASVYWYAISYTIDFAISFILIMIFSQISQIKVKFINFDSKVLAELLIQSWPIIISSILVVMYTRLDQIMIMNMLGEEAVGVFNVAIRISEFYIFIPTALATSFYPMIAQNDDAKAIRFYFDIVFVSSALIAIVVIIASYFMIPVLFGTEYIKSFNILCVVIFSTVFAMLGAACTNVMIIRNLTYMRLVRAAIGLSINYMLNIYLIPRHGIIGAAYASLVSQVFAAWISNAFNRRSFDCFIWQTQTVFTLGIRGGGGLIKLIFNRRESYGENNKLVKK